MGVYLPGKLSDKYHYANNKMGCWLGKINTDNDFYQPLSIIRLGKPSVSEIKLTIRLRMPNVNRHHDITCMKFGQFYRFRILPLSFTMISYEKILFAAYIDIAVKLILLMRCELCFNFSSIHYDDSNVHSFCKRKSPIAMWLLFEISVNNAAIHNKGDKLKCS